MKNFIFLLILCIQLCFCEKALSAVPVVIWHGMGDTCCNPLSMGRIKRLIESNVEGVYVKSLMFGGNVVADTEHGFFANMNELVESACTQIAEDPKLSQGYNAIGFSQGAQFLRAVAERCPNPPMKNYISVGGQQQGIFGIPYCATDQHKFCLLMSKMLDYGAYTSFVQTRSVQAQYWHDPYDENGYQKKNIFLADINNEGKINMNYKKNFMKLKNILLIKFSNDHMIVPRESSWFQFYAPGTTILQTLNETRLYQEDLIGLKQLNEAGKVKMVAIDGDHLQISTDEFIKYIINPYLK